jgi:iron complex transport system substrate-binding protein
MMKRAMLVAVMALAFPAKALTPQRIVSLDLCTDWLLSLHAERAQIAALSPMLRKALVPEINWVDASWPTHDGTLEGVLALHPDLVITGEYNALMLRKRLAALDVRVEVLPLPQTLADITTYEQRLLTLIGQPASRASTPPPATDKALAHRLLILGANGIGTGTGTMENDVLQRAGWRNYLAESGYVKLDLERLVTDPPDAVLWAVPDHPALAYGLAKHPALKRAVPPDKWLATDYWRWECPGPWTWGLIEQLRAWRN